VIPTWPVRPEPSQFQTKTPQFHPANGTILKGARTYRTFQFSKSIRRFRPQSYPAQRIKNLRADSQPNTVEQSATQSCRVRIRYPAHASRQEHFPNPLKGSR